MLVLVCLPRSSGGWRFATKRTHPRSGACDAKGGGENQRPVMLHQAFKSFPGEIQSVKIGIAMLQLGHQPQRMGIVIEAADILGHRIQRFLAGMTERRMPEVVG